MLFRILLGRKHRTKQKNSGSDYVWGKNKTTKKHTKKTRFRLLVGTDKQNKIVN